MNVDTMVDPTEASICRAAWDQFNRVHAACRKAWVRTENGRAAVAERDARGKPDTGELGEEEPDQRDANVGIVPGTVTSHPPDEFAEAEKRRGGHGIGF